ncbi:Gag-Pol polyprotein [Pseudohyphozyma bogoriensis]|nr:Gag-Pol polyprotein [Pseudohyphozyma bogoriensis]
MNTEQRMPTLAPRTQFETGAPGKKVRMERIASEDVKPKVDKGKAKEKERVPVTDIVGLSDMFVGASNNVKLDLVGRDEARKIVRAVAKAVAAFSDWADNVDPLSGARTGSFDFEGEKCVERRSVCSQHGRALLDGEGRPASPEAADIFDALDYTISSFLVLSIDPSINYLVDGKETTADIISALREHFAPSSAQGAVSLLKHLFTLRLASTSLPSIDAFIKDFRDTTSTLERDGLCIGTIQLSVLLLSIMEQHSSLKTLATTLTVSSHSAATLPTPEDILSRLRDEGRPDQHVVVGHLAASSTSRARGPPPGPCFTPGCGQPHWLDECQHPGADATRAERKRQRDEKSRRRGKAKSANSAEASTPAPTGPSSSAPSASLATLLGDDYGGGVAAWNSTLAPKDRSRSADYKLDSGATHHMSGDRQHFSSFVACTPEPVHGIGGSLFATGLGQVLLVENISSNLVSISQLLKSGFSTLFDGAARILKQDKLVAQGHAKGGLYVLTADVVPPSALCW